MFVCVPPDARHKHQRCADCLVGPGDVPHNQLGHPGDQGSVGQGPNQGMKLKEITTALLYCRIKCEILSWCLTQT